MPDGHNADAFRKLVLESFNMSLGTGLSKLAGKVFRIGHLGDTNELTILGALAGVEMGTGAGGRPASEGRRRCGDGVFRRDRCSGQGQGGLICGGLIDLQRVPSSRSGARFFS